MALLASLPALQPAHSLLRTGPVATSSCAGRCAGSGTCPEDCSKLPGRSKPLPHGRRGRRRVLPSPSSASARPSFLTGVGTPWRGSPRVASRTRQPWAGGHNPFGIEARALSPTRSAHPAVSARSPVESQRDSASKPSHSRDYPRLPVFLLPHSPHSDLFRISSFGFRISTSPVCALQISAV